VRNLRRKVRELPLRLAAGSYVLNAGLSMWNADETTAKQLEGFACGRPARALPPCPGHAAGGKPATHPATHSTRLPLSKDVWLAGIGGYLVIDGLLG
jgi:hypothetical protein